jgi:hypothetical protein
LHVRSRPENDAQAGHRGTEQRRRIRQVRLKADTTYVSVVGASSMYVVSGFSRTVYRIERFRQTEVEDLHFAVGRDLDIRRLEIAMDDAFLVRGFERIGDLPRDHQGFVKGDGARREPIRERGAFDQFEDECGCPVRFFEAVDRTDVGMVQRRQELRFALKASQAFRIGGERFRQDFERDVAIQLRIARAIYLAHATRADR